MSNITYSSVPTIFPTWKSSLESSQPSSQPSFAIMNSLTGSRDLSGLVIGVLMLLSIILSICCLGCVRMIVEKKKRSLTEEDDPSIIHLDINRNIPVEAEIVILPSPTERNNIIKVNVEEILDDEREKCFVVDNVFVV